MHTFTKANAEPLLPWCSNTALLPLVVGLARYCPAGVYHLFKGFKTLFALLSSTPMSKREAENPTNQQGWEHNVAALCSAPRE
jgi:hypothetical protein